MFSDGHMIFRFLLSSVFFVFYSLSGLDSEAGHSDLVLISVSQEVDKRCENSTLSSRQCAKLYKQISNLWEAKGALRKILDDIPSKDISESEIEKYVEAVQEARKVLDDTLQTSGIVVVP